MNTAINPTGRKQQLVLSDAQRQSLAEALSRQRERHERTEREARRALAFKDVMLQEVNHRAKNTLSAAASLLSMHSRATASPEVRAALQDSYRRLHLLARAHELLYSNADSSQSILMPDLLQTLADAHDRSFSEGSAVRLHVICDQVMLPADMAITMGLFANEAVTNSYNHGFPPGIAGTITVQLANDAQNGLVLRVADTGVGMHAAHTEGMGLKLIRSFAAQLKGTLAFTSPAEHSGLVITLTIAPPSATHVEIAPGASETQALPGIE